jgi:hypothetical protein
MVDRNLTDELVAGGKLILRQNAMRAEHSAGRAETTLRHKRKNPNSRNRLADAGDAKQMGWIDPCFQERAHHGRTFCVYNLAIVGSASRQSSGLRYVGLKVWR